LIRLVAALIGGALLFAGVAMFGLYSFLVNRSGLNFDFGRLMGCYIVAFFVISQVVAGLIFRDVPSGRTLLGGALIIAGGITILS
jgi:drug/metabolite transporter (DMT)-like permease